MARPSLREKLASSAVETLHASGFNGCSIQDITDAAGVPKGSFFNHFENKEALAIDAPSGLAEAVEKWFAGQDGVLSARANAEARSLVVEYDRVRPGAIVAALDRWPLPDDGARGMVPPREETCYAVRFRAADLWGSGDHTVTVDLWESYLDRA